MSLRMHFPASFDELKENVPQILSVKTRSMTRKEQQVEQKAQNGNELEIERPKVIEEPVSNFTKKIARFKVAEIVVSRNEPIGIIKVVICAYKGHQCMFELTVKNKNSDQVTLRQVTSSLESTATSQNINRLQWPLYDSFF